MDRWKTEAENCGPPPTILCIGDTNDIWPFHTSLNPCQNQVEVCNWGNQSVDLSLCLSKLAGISYFYFFDLKEGNDLRVISLKEFLKSSGSGGCGLCQIKCVL